MMKSECTLSKRTILKGEICEDSYPSFPFVLDADLIPRKLFYVLFVIVY